MGADILGRPGDFKEDWEEAEERISATLAELLLDDSDAVEALSLFRENIPMVRCSGCAEGC